MKLKITEESWGINCRTGAASVRKTGEQRFDCLPGELPPFGSGRRRFVIDAADGESVTLSVVYADSRFNKTWLLKKGEGAFYRPMSRDGGYQYRISVE